MNRERARWLLFALALLVAWIGQVLVLRRVQGTPYASALVSTLQLSALLATPGLVLLSMIFVAGVGLLVTRRHGLSGTLGAVAAFSVSWLVALLEASQWPDRFGVHHGKLLPVAALGAYALTALLSQRSPQAEREARGWEAAAGVVAAVYFLAGCSKLVGSGLAWFEPSNLGLLIGERLDTTVTAFAWARGAVVRSPLACGALAFAAVAVELAAPIFLVPRFRRTFAVAAAATHFGIWVLLGYFYPAWLLVLGAFAIGAGVVTSPAHAERATGTRRLDQ